MTTTPPARQHVPTDQAGPELLPCPLCGGPADYRGAAIRCTSFACNTSVSPVWTTAEIRKAKGDHAEKLRIAIEQTAERWNRREAVDMAECAAFSAGYEAGEAARADLAAPSAPSEVEGLVQRLWQGTYRIVRHHSSSTIEAVDDVDETMHEAATALTALQSEVERLRGKLRDACNLGLVTLERAETAEAERDVLLAAIGDWARPTGANGMTVPSDQHPLMVARAKLKGEV